MRFFAEQFFCTLSLRLRNGKNWIVLILLPLLILGVIAMTPREEVTTTVTVGVALPEDGAERFWELLSGQNSGILTFVEAEEETIDRNVASGQWDCGLILPEDFSQRLEELDMRRLMVLRISGGSTVYPLVQESVSACLAQLAGPYIAREYLLESGIVPQEQMPQIQSRLEAELGDSDRVLVNMRSANGETLEVPELTQRGITRFLCWLIAAVILVRMVFGAADLGKWLGSGAAKRMGALRSATEMLTARSCADGVMMLASGILAVLMLKGGIWGCLAVVGYTLFWVTASVLLAHFPRVYPALPVLIPFVVVISFLFSSVLLDIGLVFPALAGVSCWLPGAMFLAVWSGEAGSLAVLLSAALLWLLCAMGTDRLQNRNNR